jgi:outer membrane protein assembly factor BamB
MQSFGARSLVVSLVLGLVIAPAAWAGDWTRFRGPNGAGVDDTTPVPTEFGPDRNVAWKTEAPFGRSSPVLTENRVFLTAVDGDQLLTIGYDRKTGGELWRRGVERREHANLHIATDSSSPTPVTDGRNVYAFFQEAGLVSYDADGAERWRLALGPFLNYYSIASSPVIVGSRLFQLCDQAEGSFLVAVDKDSGRELWRAKRPARLENYSTPILSSDSEPTASLLVLGSRWLDAYDLATGKVVWSASGIGAGPVASPVVGGNLVFVVAPNHAEEGWSPFGPLLEEHDANGDGQLARDEVAETWMDRHYGWLDADESGGITAEDWKRIANEVVIDEWGLYALRMGSGGAPPEKVWNYRQNLAYIPSPLLYREVLYMATDGILSTLDPKTGELLKRGRLGEGGGEVYASPVAADGKVYVSSTEGSVLVLEAGGDWSILAENDLGEPIYATPAIADGRLYVRTRGTLYAFATPPTEATAEARTAH